MNSRLLLLLLLALRSAAVMGAPREGAPGDYLEFVRAQASTLRAGDSVPRNLEHWNGRKAQLREELEAAWGEFPDQAADLQPRKLGELVRDGYRVEKIIFQTLPDVWMTANAYVPEHPQSSKLPALLMVHGHWPGAKQDPVVQARCIGAAKLGFFVLAVDAFGAGERGVGEALGEYHGDMTAATLLPVGLPLSGLQVYENMRAVDYLQSRPEVDPERIGITGASGGGNQTMYASAWDERFTAAVPVCSVGNYQAYLGAACCLCEVVPGALRFTEEGGVLGMVAPRALMVINATKDSRQFSVEQAQVSIAGARPIFDLFDSPDKLRHVTFESGHDYSQPMREAVYGWMNLHLKGAGDGSPVSEPPLKTEDPEVLRCFPGDSRPDDWMTIPRFAAAEAQRLNHLRHKKGGRTQEVQMRTVERLLGGFPEKGPLEVEVQTADAGRVISFSPEPGIRLKATHQPGREGTGLLIAINAEGAARAAQSDWVRAAKHAGWSVATLELRATGELSWAHDKVGRAPDHTTTEWGLWIGRPLIGQWVWDVRRFLDALAEADGGLPGKVMVAGSGPAGVAAIGAAGMDNRISGAGVSGMLASYVTDQPYEGQRLAVIIPGILREFGDIPDLAALVAPKKLLVRGGVAGNGKALNTNQLSERYQPAIKAFAESESAGAMRIQNEEDPIHAAWFFAE